MQSRNLVFQSQQCHLGRIRLLQPHPELGNLPLRPGQTQEDNVLHEVLPDADRVQDDDPVGIFTLISVVIRSIDLFV